MGDTKEAVALYTSKSPLQEESPYHAFARCPPTTPLCKPRLWPGAESSRTVVRLLWNDDALYVCWELEGLAQKPIDDSLLDPEGFAALPSEVQLAQRTVLLDARVECFLWQPATTDPDAERVKRPRLEAAAESTKYYAFEINYGGKVLTSRGQFGGDKGFDWDSSGAFKIWTDELSIGFGAGASPVPGAGSKTQPFKRVVVAEILWSPLGMQPGHGICIGLHRAEHVSAPGDRMRRMDVEELLSRGLIWSTWNDPGDDVVNFHRPECFGKLVLTPIGKDIDYSVRAARLVKPGKLLVIPSPLPSLSDCPDGSVLVQAKYASVCGSDMPYIKATGFRPASLYWDRDGFCGHEVVGIIKESKSSRFKPGDAVMSLPSAYFKAHVSGYLEWYREEVHGVLLKEFPVRGGFSQVYTSHELYTYKIKECKPKMLAAQALGTMLRMARRLGPVLGKVVVVQGQGQNGLIATRLMSQLCAKTIIAVEPIAHRREKAMQFGADFAVSPGEEANAAIAEATNGRGADIVLEMVGHNQDTINACLDYVATGGTVVAFGVPDDAFYNKFAYTTFFRKFINLMSSVIPDPQVDFPQAVELIEKGRYDTEGIFTHTLPLADVAKAFDIASNYKDGVVKLVLDLS